MSNFLWAQWPAPAAVRALTTLRDKGHSLSPYASNNLAMHVGDQEKAVWLNRQDLRTKLPPFLNLPAWLNQTHSTDAVIVEEDLKRDADAAITRSLHQPLAILTADCLPIFLCNQSGDEIALIHAGWRGLLNGIIENTLLKMKSNPKTVLAWIGPAICQKCFVVGESLYEQFKARYPFSARAFCKENESWTADLPQLATLVLQAQGLSAIYASGLCTFERSDLFYSYRRASKTGRIAHLIWLQNN